MGEEAPKTSTIGRSIACKAAVVWSPGEKFKIEDVNVAPPRRDQVRIQILYSAICHTDVTVLNVKGLAPRFPVIAGHESAGIVESVGENVTRVKAGDYVLPFIQAQCGKCSSCKDERTNVCKARPMSTISSTLLGDDKPHFTTNDGKTVNRLAGLSTFSQYTVVHKDNVVRIKSEVPMEKACLLSCGVATGLGAVWKVAKVRRGSTVAIFGLGTVGLAAVQACKLSGASRIVGVDINPKKFQQAKEFGLTDFVNSKDTKSSVPEEIKGLIEGGVDYSFECVGAVELMADAVESTQREGGMTVVIGVPSSRAASFEINVHSLLLGRTVTGTIMGGLRVRDLPDLVEKCLAKDFQLDQYITHKFPFTQINEAMEVFHSGDCLRCVLDMSS